MTVVKFENVGWSRQGKEILKDINWQIEKGEHWAILGLNGSGKTSILNIMNGYSYPSKGEVHVLGEHFGQGAKIPELRQKIGYVSSSLEQFYGTFRRQRVRGVVLSGKGNQIGVYHEVEDSEREKARQLLNDLGIGHLEEADFSLISQGEARRVLIARALMTQPELLILDEPCAGLDIKAREEVLAMMDALVERGVNLIYVTHYVEEITPVITHILLVKNGSVVEAGKKEAVLTDDLLSETFDLPVEVHWQANRPWLTVK